MAFCCTRSARVHPVSVVKERYYRLWVPNTLMKRMGDLQDCCLNPVHSWAIQNGRSTGTRIVVDGEKLHFRDRNNTLDSGLDYHKNKKKRMSVIVVAGWVDLEAILEAILEATEAEAEGNTSPWHQSVVEETQACCCCCCCCCCYSTSIRMTY